MPNEDNTKNMKKDKQEVPESECKWDCNVNDKEMVKVVKFKCYVSEYFGQNKPEFMIKQKQRKQKACDMFDQRVTSVHEDRQTNDLKNRDLQNFRIKNKFDNCQCSIVNKIVIPDTPAGTKHCPSQNCMFAKHKLLIDDSGREIMKLDQEKDVNLNGDKKYNLQEVKELFQIEEGRRCACKEDLEKEKVIRKSIDEMIEKKNKIERESHANLNQTKLTNDKKIEENTMCVEQTNIKTFVDPLKTTENEKSDDEMEEIEEVEMEGQSDFRDEFEAIAEIDPCQDSCRDCGQEVSWTGQDYLESEESLQSLPYSKSCSLPYSKSYFSGVNDNRYNGSMYWMFSHGNDQILVDYRKLIDQWDVKIIETIKKSLSFSADDDAEIKYQHDEQEEESQHIEKDVEGLENTTEQNWDNDGEIDEMKIDNFDSRSERNAQNNQDIQSTDKDDVKENEEDIAENEKVSTEEKNGIELKEDNVNLFAERNDRQVETEICDNKDQIEVKTDNGLKEVDSRNKKTSSKSCKRNKKNNRAIIQLSIGYQMYLNELGMKIKRINSKVSEMKNEMMKIHNRINLIEDQFKWPNLHAMRVSHPDVPDSSGSDIWLPKDRHESRRNKMFTPANGLGRQCSNFANGGSGGPMNVNGSSNSNQYENDAGKDGSQENNNNDSSQNDNSDDGKTNQGASGSGNAPLKKAIALIAKMFDPKQCRRKHHDKGSKDSEGWLGRVLDLIKRNKGPVVNLPADNNMKTCVRMCLDKPEELSADMLKCILCTTINSLLLHYASCSANFNGCEMCLLIFSIICTHVYGCTNNSSLFKCNPLCINIKLMLLDNDHMVCMRTLWFNVRKKLAQIIDLVENKDYTKILGKAVTKQPSLACTPENLPVTDTACKSGANALAHKRTNLPHVPEVTVLDVKVQAFQSLTGDEPDLEMPSVKGLEIFGGSGMCSVTGRHVYHSLPLGPPGGDEVIYGGKRQLVKVSSIWENFKAQSQAETRLARHNRGEGVILSEFKNALIIAHRQYNKDFQWVKEAHLGNGTSGKCFLAKDIITEFQFCIKELHISNYKKEEIELWSELDHPNIVQIYGAIRHGERIFIFQEFIEGGCLTEAINMQKKLNCCLSQFVALHYFRQILEVLVYLKSRNILHEDLKADNILLKTVGDDVSIKVTDFGLARRCLGKVPIGTKLVGTQTQWSPEKAKGVGYGFPAELWAGVCVLMHMLSGWPPWIKRFENLCTLILLIVEYSPPIDDIPTHIDDQIKDLIVYGFTVCQGERPSAEVLLKHAAFRLLEERTINNICYSILNSQTITKYEFAEETNSDFIEIFHGLGAFKPKEAWSEVRSEIRSDAKHEVSSVDQVQLHADNKTNGRETQPSVAVQNLDSMDHLFFSYIQDDMQISSQRLQLTDYHPDTSTVREESVGCEGKYDEVIMKQLSPNFAALEILLSVMEKDVDANDSNESSAEEVDDPLKNFDVLNALKILNEPSTKCQPDPSTQMSSPKEILEPKKSPIMYYDTYISIDNDDCVFTCSSSPFDLKIYDLHAAINNVVPSSVEMKAVMHRGKRHIELYALSAQANDMTDWHELGPRPKVHKSNFAQSGFVSPPPTQSSTQGKIRFPSAIQSEERTKSPKFISVLNPRPATLQASTKTLDLHLDIKRAQSGKPASCGPITAPITSPSKTNTMQTTASCQKAHSEISHAQGAPNMAWNLPNNKEGWMSHSISKSQFEEQDEAFETSILCTFKSGVNGKEVKMRFTCQYFSRTCCMIIYKELVQIAQEFGLSCCKIMKEDGR